MKSLAKMFSTLLLVALTLGQAWAQPPKILITYDSPDGHTEKVAQWVAEGVREHPEAILRYKKVTETTHDDLIWADAIIVGSPVYNTGPTGAVGTFLAEWPFDNSPLKNRVGAAFVSSKGATAGAENTLFQVLKTMMLYRMVVVGGEDWRSGFGVAYIRDGESERSLGYVKRQAIDMGDRVVRVTEATEVLRTQQPAPEAH